MIFGTSETPYSRLWVLLQAASCIQANVPLSDQRRQIINQIVIAETAKR